jgi:SAM-dependent methyltransferase
MFTKTARFYDALYSFKDYAAESAAVVQLTGKDGGTLLDVACGTGRHLEFLGRRFECEGLDLDPGLLDVARERLPGIPLHLGDMVRFDLGKRFDVVTCLFSAIGYAETVQNLNRAIQCFADHLEPGGVVIIEPWLDPSVWRPGTLHALFVDEPDVKIARMSSSATEGDVSVIGFEYLISTAEGIQRESEVHRLGLFSRVQYLDAMRMAGLEGSLVEGGPSGRGIFLGRTSL